MSVETRIETMGKDYRSDRGESIRALFLGGITIKGGERAV